MLERSFLIWPRGGIVIGLVIALCGCVNNATAPIAHKSAAPRESATVHRSAGPVKKRAAARPASYVVQRGDTLYSIAWRFGIDFRPLSQWNRLRNPNLINVGQRLRLRAPLRPRNKSAANNRPKSPAVTNIPKRDKKATPAKTRPRPINWSWPADGAVKVASSALGTKGIEISGVRGQLVKSAAGGTVVYSGSGLRGYGQLIIIKHSEDFLSAYAHNERLLVADGAAVKRGQQIAEMGDSDAKRVMLHFEIRRDGKAVEPRKYLPQR